MKALLSTCLVLALFSPVASLTCSTCIGILQPCMNSTNQVCNSGEGSCGSFYLTNLKFPLTKMVMRSCTPSAMCQDGTYRITVQKNIDLQALMKCCDKEMCNKALNIAQPIPKMAPNGRGCPGCYSMEADDCQPNVMIPCKGDQTQCIEGAGSLKMNETIMPLSLPFAFKGCTTPNTCTAQMPVGYSNSGNEFKLHRMSCKQAKFINSTLTDHILLGK